MRYLTSPDVLVCFEQAQFLVADNQDSVCVANVVEELLEKLSTINDYQHDSECLLNDVAEFVKEASFVHSTVSMVLFDSFPSMKVPGPFLDILPAVLSTVPSEQLDVFAMKLFEIFKEDAFVVRVLSVLADLSISARLADTIQRTIVDSLPSMDSADFPTMLTISLKFSGTKHVSDIVNAWRDVVSEPLLCGVAISSLLIYQVLSCFIVSSDAQQRRICRWFWKPSGAT